MVDAPTPPLAGATPSPSRRLRAVPLTYAGVSFRSTLEADWAATLDSLEITWKYEPEPYRLPSGELYAPDLWLPTQRIWMEVKGPHFERIHKTRELDDCLDSWMGRWTEPFVVVALAATRGEATLETPTGGTVHFMLCDVCDHYTIMAEDYAWRCRLCTAELRIRYFAPRIPFARAPRGGS